MQINPIQNQRLNNINSNPSFGSVVIEGKQYYVYRLKGTGKLGRYLEQTNKLENLKINLKEMAKSWKLTPAMIFALKNFFATIGEREAEDCTINLNSKRWGKNSCYLTFPKPANAITRDYRINFVDKSEDPWIHYDADESYLKLYIKRKIWDFVQYLKGSCGYPARIDIGGVKQRISGKIKSYGGIHVPDEKAVLSIVNKVFHDYIKRLATEIDVQIAAQPEREAIEKLHRNNIVRIYEAELGYPDVFPASSLTCTLDDILNYIDKHRSKYMNVTPLDGFNTPVTKDGETLLIALAHVQPTAENTEKYIKLIDELSRSSEFIDFNQRDSVGVPFVDHVLNSGNKLLLLLASSADNLRYEPELENTFDSIKDQEFKEMVLKMDLFNNIHNLKYKTIFHQPNPKL